MIAMAMLSARMAMDDQDKVAPDQGSRQGRSGQAGRQVARLLGAILDPAARRRGFAEASLLADWATHRRPGAGTALPAGADRPSRPAGARRRHAAAAGGRRRRDRAAARRAAADRADQHLFRPPRRPPAPAAADAAAAGQPRHRRRRPGRCAPQDEATLAAGVAEVDDRACARRSWRSAAPWAARARDAGRASAALPRRNADPIATAARTPFERSLDDAPAAAAICRRLCPGPALPRSRPGASRRSRRAGDRRCRGAGHDHRVLLAHLPALRGLPQRRLPELKKRYIDTGKVRLVLRDFPLDESALKAAMIAHCAGPERQPQFIEVFFAQQQSWARAKDPIAALKQLARAGRPERGPGRRLPRRQGARGRPCCRRGSTGRSSSTSSRRRPSSSTARSMPATRASRQFAAIIDPLLRQVGLQHRRP